MLFLLMKYNDLKKILSKCLKVPISKIKDSASSKTLEEWDSLSQLFLLSELDVKTKGKTSKIKGIAKILNLKKLKITLEKNNILKK